MKRYLLFAGHNYYPAGGTNDLVGAFDTYEQAVERGQAGDATFASPFDWWHVFDTVEGVSTHKNGVRENVLPHPLSHANDALGRRTDGGEDVLIQREEHSADDLESHPRDLGRS